MANGTQRARQLSANAHADKRRPGSLFVQLNARNAGKCALRSGRRIHSRAAPASPSNGAPQGALGTVRSSVSLIWATPPSSRQVANSPKLPFHPASSHAHTCFGVVTTQPPLVCRIGSVRSLVDHGLGKQHTLRPALAVGLTCSECRAVLVRIGGLSPVRAPTIKVSRPQGCGGYELVRSLLRDCPQGTVLEADFKAS